MRFGCFSDVSAYVARVLTYAVARVLTYADLLVAPIPPSRMTCQLPFLDLLDL